jgi:HD-GYP domain-containing protein (c-di-GMP phosphodiesterase class II)
MQLELDLRGRKGQLQGLLALVHPVGSSHGEPAFFEFARQLSGSLAVSIETRQLIEAQKNLLDAVIRLMADAIDAKSPYTGGHCERVPELATMLVDRMSADKEGLYADFSMTEDERYEFYLGAWLHDCGKVTSPEHIVDKATKLEVIYNRIHEVRNRFEVLWRDAEIEHLRRVVAGVPEAESLAQRDVSQQQLREDYAFVAECNVGGEFMADAAIERLRGIAQQTWQRYFDDTLGLASEEARRLKAARPDTPDLPATESLLADRADHVVVWDGKKPPVEKDDPNNIWGFDMKLPKTKQNMGEVYNLAIRRGTLTDEDRFKINDHIVQTYIMLRGLPWPDNLKRVPDIAATHHEKMDGKGYPRCLGSAQLSQADKAMALSDIFEALTAADRPYKAPKTLTESLKIMAFMCKDQHLDVDLYRYFLHSGLWQTYAERYMKPEQIDKVDIAAIEKLLPAPVAAPA